MASSSSTNASRLRGQLRRGGMEHSEALGTRSGRRLGTSPDEHAGAAKAEVQAAKLRDSIAKLKQNIK